MNSIWLSLLWKEWCEFRWKLAALTVSIVIGQAILMSVFMGEPMRDMATGLVVSMIFCLSVYGLLAGAFVGMTVAAGENSRRTMRFTQALPISMWQAAIVRILVAMVTVVVPIVAVVTLIWVFTAYVWQEQVAINEAVLSEIGNVRNPWNISDFFVSRAVATIVGVVSLLLWVSAYGVNRSDEVRAGAVAFLCCAVLWGVWTYGMEENIFGLRLLLEKLSVALPGGPALAGNFNYGGANRNVDLLILIALLSHAVVFAFIVARYGRSTGRISASGKQFISDWFRFSGAQQPFRSQSLTIIWKQVRELGPLALMAVAGILAFMAFAYVADDPSRWAARDWANLLGGLTLAVAGLVTLIAGIGVIYEDYSRGLPNFWRSRPINLHQWFFLKYVTGILVLVVAFVPLFLIAAKLTDWQMATKDDVQMVVMIFLMVYASALAAYALVRQPIYAVVLAIFSIWFLPGIAFVFQRLFPEILVENDMMVFYITIFLVPAATLLAWQAVVRDWGWKQHR